MQKSAEQHHSRIMEATWMDGMKRWKQAILSLSFIIIAVDSLERIFHQIPFAASDGQREQRAGAWLEDEESLRELDSRSPSADMIFVT